MADSKFLRVGVGGAVGSGKTALLTQLCKEMIDHYDMAVVTNDIYTREDAEFLLRNKAMDSDRIVVTKSDLLVINKIDLAPMVGASLEVMDTDTKRMRGDKPYVFTNLKAGEGVQTIIDFIVHQGMLDKK